MSLSKIFVNDIQIAKVDDYPIDNSENLIKSSGVYNAEQEQLNKISSVCLDTGVTFNYKVIAKGKYQEYNLLFSGIVGDKTYIRYNLSDISVS